MDWSHVDYHVFISSVWKFSYAISNYRIWLDYCLVLLFSLIQFSYKICQLYTIQLKSSSTKNNSVSTQLDSVCFVLIAWVPSFHLILVPLEPWMYMFWPKCCFWPCPVFQYDSGPGGAELHICSDGYREQTALRFLPALIGSSQLPLHPQVQTAGFKSTSLIVNFWPVFVIHLLQISLI